MNSPASRERGSVLILALLLAAVIAITLTSYLKMATNALNLAQRSMMSNDAMNLTESGLELGMVAINTNSWGSPWVTSGGNAKATFTGFSYSQGISGSVTVVVQNYATTNPVLVAKGTITPPQGPTLDKMVAVSGLIQRSFFAKGLVGKHGITFHGNNSSVDSWDSLLNADGTLRSSPANYSSSVARDHGSIASVDVYSTTDVMNADIWGTASVGGSSTSSINLGPQGRVGPFGTGSGVLDPNSVSTNFTTNLPTVSAPTPSSANTNVLSSNIDDNLTLPRAGDVAVTDSTGKVTYYYKFPALTGGTLTIAPNSNVVLLPTAGAGTSAISLSGNGDGISVSGGSTLAIYTPANISISGNAEIANANGTSQSSSIQIWGTNTSSSSPGQTISVTGNGSLTCTCYAPNAAISAKGGGNSGAIYGALVGYTIDMTGNDSFHYDEALGRQGGNGTYSPTKWIELDSASDRALYDSYF